MTAVVYGNRETTTNLLINFELVNYMEQAVTF